MGQVLLRGAYLLRHPIVLGSFLILTIGGIALTYLPLFGLPGYELSEALALGCGLLGGLIGIAAGRQERRLIQSRDPRPRRALRFDQPLNAVWMAVGAASLVELTAVFIPSAVSVLRTLQSTRCDPFLHIYFLPALVVPSSLVAAALGVFCSLFCRGALKAVLAYAVFVLASLAITAWPLYFGPQVYAFNHLLGYVPGPLYDESIQVPASLLWFRLETIAVVVFVVALTSLLLDMKEGLVRRPFLRPLLLALAMTAGLAIFVIEDRAAGLGIRMNSAFLEEKLGGVRQSSHFRVVYPRGKSRIDAERLVRDLEFRYSQIEAFLGTAPGERINVFVYRSADEKRDLVGAAITQYAKPWRLELHINDGPFPNPTVKHELAHVMAAPLGSSPFRVTTRFRVVPNIGVIEGTAVAVDNPVSELTLHGWAAGLRREKLASDVRELFKINRFYASAAPRAYTLAGSFLSYLVDTYGKEKFQRLYAEGNFERSYQRSLDALASEWERYVDALPLDNAALNLTFSRFREGSIFSKSCAREVADLRRRVDEAVVADPEEALRLLERAHEIQPNEPTFELTKASVLQQLDLAAEASEVLKRLEKSVKDYPALAAEVAMAEANVAHMQGNAEETRQHLEHILALKPGGSLERTAQIKLAALNERVGGVIWSYLEPGNEIVRALRVREALVERPTDPLLNYLLGRRLCISGEPVPAVRFLQHSLERPLPSSVSREAWRLKIEADYLSGDCAAVKNDRGRAPSFDEAFQAASSDWVERCNFESKPPFNGALAPKTPFQ